MEPCCSTCERNPVSGNAACADLMPEGPCPNATPVYGAKVSAEWALILALARVRSLAHSLVEVTGELATVRQGLATLAGPGQALPWEKLLLVQQALRRIGQLAESQRRQIEDICGQLLLMPHGE